MNQSFTHFRRIELNMSQRQFAERFGIPLRTVQSWDQETRKPSPYVVRLIKKNIQLEKENDVLTKLINEGLNNE